MSGSEAEDAPPASGACRWTARRKVAVVKAVRAGRLTPETACRTYGLSGEELAAWERLLDRHGPDGLKVTRLQRLR